MTQFSVIIEDSKPDGIRGSVVPDHKTRRVVEIEADNLDDAWEKARQTYYFGKTMIQIVDIKSGGYQLPPIEEGGVPAPKSQEEESKDAAGTDGAGTGSDAAGAGVTGTRQDDPTGGTGGAPTG